MGKIGDPKTLTVNCQGESRGVLTFFQMRHGFYELTDILEHIVACINQE